MLAEQFGERAEIIHSSYLEAAQRLVDDGRLVDLILLDLGVSSPQMADVFLDETAHPKRAISVLFGDSREAPTIAEYAMFTAWGASARSLTASRRVGAAIVQGGSVVSMGMNEVPDIAGIAPDALLGYDYSELEKQRLAETAAGALAERQGWLDERRSAQFRDDRVQFMRDATETLRSSKLADVIEYQRAVHAEMWAIIDATKRGVGLHDAVMYGTTYTCHLCWKHIFTSGIKELYYIDSYPKSQALRMYETTAGLLKPYVGVAPHKYLRLFYHRPLPAADDEGHIRPVIKETAQPLLGEVSVSKPRVVI